jgi:hypothetical protein
MDTAGLGIDDLRHFGVKGMRWGQHKSGKGPKATASESSTAARVIAESVGKTAKALAKKHGPDIQTARAGFAKPTPTKQSHAEKISAAGGLHKISDKDLKAMLSRLDTEKKYNAILNEDRQKRIDGGKALLRVLGEVGKFAIPIVLGAVAAKGAASGFRGESPFKAPIFDPKVISGVARSLSRFPQGH